MKKLPERSRERGVPEDEQVKQHALAHGKERQHQPDTTIVHDHMMLIIIDYASNESTCTAEATREVDYQYMHHCCTASLCF